MYLLYKENIIMNISYNMVQIKREENKELEKSIKN